jgi:HPt (histidine-containing phosphotransfer) domain-containing protein
MIDLEHLKRFVGNDETVIAKLLAHLRTELPRLMHELELQLDAGAFQAANITAHTLKTQLSYIGATDAAHWAAQLERETEENKVDAFSLTQLKAFVGQVEI